jgi:hypothetical protein
MSKIGSNKMKMLKARKLNEGDHYDVFYNRDKFLKEISNARGIRNIWCCCCCLKEKLEVQVRRVTDTTNEKKRVLNDVDHASRVWKPKNIGYAFVFMKNRELISELKEEKYLSKEAL